ncbi:MAG: nucleotidyltransferase domain-containing protein [Haliscomenobacter sp.]|nr:nucleotidyltransferase domain-containing protein [Haliscomenobacter sp.]MBK8656994.1 nucleotidyltransferase domain-containing protein [Haliscomenobacter sp.]
MAEVAPLIFLHAHKSEMESLCRQYHVKRLYLFGSALTAKFRPDSDLDFLVTFHDIEPLEYADNFFDFRDALARLFQRKVDLVESQTLKNPFFKSAVDATKVIVYGGSDREMAV